MPQRVIGHKDTATLQARGNSSQNCRVALFIHVVEDKVEFARSLGEACQRITHVDVDGGRYSGALEVAGGFAGVGGAAIGVVNFGARPCGTRQQIAESFSLERQLRNVDKIFARVFDDRQS